MNEYLDKIRQEIEKNKSDIITELDSFDVSILGNINSNISTADNIITQLSNNNEIDFSIISSILGSMPQYKLGEMIVGDSETYQKIYEMLKDMKKDNEETSGFFDDDIEKYSKVFTNLIDEVKHFIVNKKNEYNEIISQKRELTEKLKEIRSIGIIIDKYSHEQVILSNEIQKLYTYLINENEQLDLEEKFDFYRTFSQINTERISARLNERVTENVEEQTEAPAEETVNEDFQMAQLENQIEQINNADNEYIVEENNENSEQTISEDRLLQLIGDENLTLYKNAKLLIEQYKSQLENIEIISLIPINNSEERKRAYEVYIYEDFAQAKKFILDDIENKILFEIKKDLNEGIFSEESFEELEFAYNEFKEVVNKEQEKIAKKKLKEKKERTNYMDILVELQMKDAIDLSNKIEPLLTECSIRSKNETIFRNAISQYFSKLNSSFNEFIDALKDYYFEKDNEEFKEILFDIALPILVQNYNDFLSVYNMYAEKNETNNNGNLEDEYVDNALSFYDRYNNINHILLVCDDSGISYIEDDINNSREITKKSQAFSNVVHRLGLFADNDEYEIEKSHTVKTSFVSEAIKKEFQIRSCSCGSDLRIFYSKFSTKLNEIFPEKYDKIPSIIYIYEIAYGSTDGEKKNGINQISYKRCYDRKEKLRNIRKLFNTDISNCTEEEKQSIRKQIQDSIREQNIKLGHLIVEEANIKENEKRTGGVE
ncbi:MAG: hypothetical protein J6B64_06170 [Bacilli bacterium]|nr:hypothetical protein [Bacilli bacterium]